MTVAAAAEEVNGLLLAGEWDGLVARPVAEQDRRRVVGRVRWLVKRPEVPTTEANDATQLLRIEPRGQQSERRALPAPSEHDAFCGKAQALRLRQHRMHGRYG